MLNPRVTAKQIGFAKPGFTGVGPIKQKVDSMKSMLGQRMTEAKAKVDAMRSKFTDKMKGYTSIKPTMGTIKTPKKPLL